MSPGAGRASGRVVSSRRRGSGGQMEAGKGVGGVWATGNLGRGEKSVGSRNGERSPGEGGEGRGGGLGGRGGEGQGRRGSRRER